MQVYRDEMFKDTAVYNSKKTDNYKIRAGE